MSANWTLHPALIKLRDQINEQWPDRDKSSDGTIGDAVHASRKSDHNPDKHGIVRAMDITHDKKNGPDMHSVAAALRASRDPRIAYVIFSGRIFSSTQSPWMWRMYDGKNKHTKHLHISVTDAEAPWVLPSRYESCPSCNGIAHAGACDPRMDERDL